MTKSTQTSTALFTALVLGALMLLAIPFISNAATYAYLDTRGDVQSVTADNWMMAINTAPNIALHSGVLLLGSAAGYSVSGDNLVRE